MIIRLQYITTKTYNSYKVRQTETPPGTVCSTVSNHGKTEGREEVTNYLRCLTIYHTKSVSNVYQEPNKISV